MSTDLARFIVMMAGLLTNLTIMLFAFPSKYSRRFSACTLVLVFIAFLTSVILLGPENQFGGLLGFAFIPLTIWLFKRLFFQKVFMIFLQYLCVVFMGTFSEMLAGLFMPGGSSGFLTVFLIAAMVTHAAYLGVMIKFGPRLLDKLFEHGRNADWALYSLGISFAFAVLMLLVNTPGSTFLHLSMLFFVIWSFGILCFSIISTHSRLQAQHERDLSREILSSGRGYYDKLTDMTERLHILRHDYRHHLTSMQKLLEGGHSAEAQEYLTKLNVKTNGGVMHNYCKNRVLNALLDSFAERCEIENISFSAKIILPPPETIDDYELCVIIGNLLENAITACLRTPEGRRRYIELSMRPREDNYGIKVENSYDGILKHDGKELYSTKKNGGLGISSIKSVAKRHAGEYVPVWDERNFSAFVVLKLEDEL